MENLNDFVRFKNLEVFLSLYNIKLILNMDF